MIESIIIMTISLILESIINLYISSNSYFVPLFSLLSLIFVYKILKHNKKEFLIASIIFGIVYDIVFTNFYTLNGILFLISSLIIYFCFNKFKYNLLNTLIISVILILTYNISLFLIFNLLNYYNYNFDNLIFILKHFFVSNIIYILFVYLIINKTKLKNIF